MGELLKTTASDGHEFTSYLTQPTSTPLGGLVIIQEIFGVNKHIKSIADKYAKEGYLVAAPSLFDRIDKGIELGYEPEDVESCLLYTSPSPRDISGSRMPSSA